MSRAEPTRDVDERLSAHDALRRVLSERFGAEVSVPDGLDGVDELLRLASQTSHRSWSDAPVAAELVRLLAACALSGPSKSFLQQADIVHVCDPERRVAVQSIVPEMPWMADAPVLLVFCANGRRFKRLFDRRDRPFTNDHLDGFFNPVVDATIVMTRFVAAAEAVGLVCCPISMIRNDPDRLVETLELPPRVVPVAGLCLGYPSQRRSVTPRLSLDTTFHVDLIGDLDDDASVDEFDRRYVAARAAFAAGSAANVRTWSEERVAQYAAPQRAGFGAFVRAQQFDLS